MAGFLVVVVLLLSGLTTASAQSTCDPIFMGRMVSQDTLKDGTVRIYSVYPKEAKLVSPGQIEVAQNVKTVGGKKAVQLANLQGSEKLVMTTLCGGTRDCSKKSCTGSNTCKEGTRGCKCE